MTSKFSDEKRMRELLEQEQATIELNLQRSAHQVVSARLAGYLMPSGRYADEGGLPFYPFIKGLLADFPANLPAISAKFSELAKKIFNQHNLIVSVTDSDKFYDDFAGEFGKFQEKLGKEIYPAQEYHWELKARNEGLTSSSRVQYVGKGANFLKLGYEFTGTMHVLETILRYDYFWTKIRVQGGAYGAFTSFNRNGMMYFGSYRDPNLTETLAVFDGTADYLAGFDASEREMDKYIIGTMSNIDTPLTPQMKGSAAATCWLRGITEADRQKARDEILDTRQKDVQKLAGLVKDCMEQNVICVFGGQEKINEHKDVFGEVRPAL